MTVSSDLARIQYACNGTTTVFSTGFAFQKNIEVKVLLTDNESTAETLLIEHVAYTLTGAMTEVAGTVTLTTAPPTGITLTVMRDVQFVQDLDGTTLSTMDAGDQEVAYDKIWHALTQLKDGIYRTLHTTDGAIIPIPLPWEAVVSAVPAPGNKIVLQITGWLGGEGPPPPSGFYIGPEFYVDDINLATNIKGDTGPKGEDSIVPGPIGVTGATGATGATGQTGAKGDKGDKGDKGEAGIGINVKGQKATVQDLPATGNVDGDAWIVQSTMDMWVWDTPTAVWINAGKIQGPPGPPGTPGAANASALASTATGNIQATNVQAAITELDTEKVSKLAAGDSMAGNLTIAKANPALILNSSSGPAEVQFYCPANSYNSFIGYVNSHPRWTFRPGNAAAETGGNAGSDFSIISFDDSDGVLHTPLKITRVDGLVTVRADPQVNLGVATKQYVDTGNNATAAEYLNNSQPTKKLTSGAVWTAAGVVDLGAATSYPINLSNGIDFILKPTASFTIAAPTNVKPGQKGLIYVVNTTGSCVVTWTSRYLFSGGVKPSLTAAANAIDVISYAVLDNTPSLVCSFSPDFK